MTTKKKLAKDQARNNAIMQKAMQRLRQGAAMHPFSPAEINACARSLHLRYADIREGVRLGIAMLYSEQARARLAWFQIKDIIHPPVAVETPALPA